MSLQLDSTNVFRVRKTMVPQPELTQEQPLGLTVLHMKRKVQVSFPLCCYRVGQLLVTDLCKDAVVAAAATAAASAAEGQVPGSVLRDAVAKP